MDRQLSISFLAAALLAVAGCFNEPVPADQVVPAGARVYLKERGLTTLAPALTALDATIVDYLNLDRNALTNIVGIEQFTALKWLRLNDNRLTGLPDLSALKNLRRLYLRGNRLTQVPETIKELPALTDLDLSGNPITEVPVWLAQKTGLENLSFSNTKIKRLPEDLSAWKGLKSLQLGGLALSPEEMRRIRSQLFDAKDDPLGTAIVF